MASSERVNDNAPRWSVEFALTAELLRAICVDLDTIILSCARKFGATAVWRVHVLPGQDDQLIRFKAFGV